MLVKSEVEVRGSEVEEINYTKKYIQNTLISSPIYRASLAIVQNSSI